MKLNPNRRAFLRSALAASLAAAGASCRSVIPAAGPADESGLAGRIAGLMLGSYLGDALGGPIEFQPPERVRQLPDPPRAWREAELLDADGIQQARERLRLRSYAALRSEPESYAHWQHDAAPGTITDDSRHKLVLLLALRRAAAQKRASLEVGDLAHAYLDWPDQAAIRNRPDYRALCADWLEEWQLGARWVLGDRDGRRALPPERMWIGLPTCCGQMTLLPLAAVHAGKPDAAYRAAYRLGYFDNGFGKDLNAAVIAGLARALTLPAGMPPRDSWAEITATMRQTDPFRHGAVRWTRRSVDRWLDFAHGAVMTCGRRPARLFREFDREFAQTTKWEAQVPFSVAFACAELAGWDPLASLQLSLEWGHDTDSYAQLLGAFVGAIHGAEIFPAAWRSAVIGRLEQDYGADFEADVQLLLSLHRRWTGTA